MDYEEFVAKKRGFSEKDRLKLYMDAVAVKGGLIESQNLSENQKKRLNGQIDLEMKLYEARRIEHVNKGLRKAQGRDLETSLDMEDLETIKAEAARIKLPN